MFGLDGNHFILSRSLLTDAYNLSEIGQCLSNQMEISSGGLCSTNSGTVRKSTTSSYNLADETSAREENSSSTTQRSLSVTEKTSSTTEEMYSATAQQTPLTAIEETSSSFTEMSSSTRHQTLTFPDADQDYIIGVEKDVRDVVNFIKQEKSIYILICINMTLQVMNNSELQAILNTSVSQSL